MLPCHAEGGIFEELCVCDLYCSSVTLNTGGLGEGAWEKTGQWLTCSWLWERMDKDNDNGCLSLRSLAMSASDEDMLSSSFPYPQSWGHLRGPRQFLFYIFGQPWDCTALKDRRKLQKWNIPLPSVSITPVACFPPDIPVRHFSLLSWFTVSVQWHLPHCHAVPSLLCWEHQTSLQRDVQQQIPKGRPSLHTWTEALCFPDCVMQYRAETHPCPTE